MRASGYLQSMLGRARRWIGPSTSGEVRYRSPEEIALQNAADALGVDLGDGYPKDLDFLDDFVAGTAESGAGDRLDASREEMLAYIQGVRNKRRRSRRRRRQRMALALTAVVTLVVVLDLELSGRPDPPVGKVDEDRFAQRIWSKLTPGTRSGRGIAKPAGPSMTTEMSDGAGRIVFQTYLDIRDDLCMSTTNLVRGLVKGKTVGGCIPPSEVSDDLSRAPAFYSGLSAAKRYVLLTGYSRSDLKRIVARTPRGRIDVKISSTWDLSSPWDPPSEGRKGSFSIKTILIRIWYGHGVRFESALKLASDSRPLDLLAVFDSGRVSRIPSWDEARRARQKRHRRIDPPHRERLEDDSIS